MEASRRQLVLLGAIVLLLAIVLYWNATRSDATPEEFSAAMSQNAAANANAGTPAGTAATPARRGAGPGPIPAVGLGKLTEAQPEPADTGRDPFRFESAAPSRAPVGAGAAPVATAPTPAVPREPTGPPPPPPIALKFIGIAKQGAGRLFAVLRDDRGVYYGAEGDIVEGRYRILRVSADVVEVSYVDGRGRTSIPMSGGRP